MRSVIRLKLRGELASSVPFWVPNSPFVILEHIATLAPKIRVLLGGEFGVVLVAARRVVVKVLH